MRHHLRLGLFLSIVVAPFALASNAKASAQLVQLNKDNLPQLLPSASEMGVQSGDVLLINDLARVVIQTAERSKDGGGGGCVILGSQTNSDAPFVTLHPGPRGFWQKAEGASVGQAAAVRFRHDASDWTAELTYTLGAEMPWVEITTTIRNNDKNKTLELPLVDDLIGSPKTSVTTEKDGVTYILHSEKGPVVALVPFEKRLVAHEAGKGHWGLVYLSGDEMPSLLGRTKARFANWGRSTTYDPVSASRGWPRAARDRDNWHRLAPGENRVVQRRLIGADDLGAARALASYASGQGSPLVRLTPFVSSAPRNAASPGAKIIGKLRGLASQPAPPVTERPAAPAAEPPEIGGSAPTLPQALPVPSLDAAPDAPSVLPLNIGEIENLPPPIE